MKKIYFLLVAILIFVSCGKKNYQAPLTAQVNVVSEDPYKTIEVRSVGFGKNEDEAYYDAETKAFEIIFFRGIPNTSVENPLIGSKESEIAQRNSAYFNDFFKNRYKSFVMSSFQSLPSQKKNGVVSVVADIKINLMSLKRDLEDHNVKRRFGL